MTEFDDIRPYYDHEVRPTLDRLLENSEFIAAVTLLKFPRLSKWLGWLLRPIVKAKLTQQLASVDDVQSFQTIVAQYMTGMMADATSGLTVSGLDALDKHTSYLFISNHRDIAMDPAFINWVLFHNGSNTLRIAIGDNLLTKPYVSDLMRLNKSFIVNRSAKAPREKLKAAKHLSAYIYHSIVNEKSNIWIAQREGRAKDGFDKTNSAVLGMIMLNRPKTQNFADYVRELRIVPVAISYEWDPCDAAKAREIYQHKTEGNYQKEEHEDVRSIALGIAGKKGHVHLAFGEPLAGNYEDTDQLVADIDQHILSSYVLHPTNCIAYEMQEGQAPSVAYTNKTLVFGEQDVSGVRAEFTERLEKMPKEHRQIAIAAYANPVISKLKVAGN